MSVANTITCLQALNAAITGIQTAPTEYPGSLATAELPCALVFPGEGEWEHTTFGASARHNRTYHIRVYVKPVAQGKGIDEAMQAVATLLWRFGITYYDKDNQQIADDPQTVLKATDEGLTDSGYVQMPYPAPGGALYHGFEMLVAAWEIANT